MELELKLGARGKSSVHRSSPTSESSSREMATSSSIYEDLDGDVDNSSDSDQMSGDLDYNSDDDVEQLSDDREDDQLAEGDGNNYNNQQEVQKEHCEHHNTNNTTCYKTIY